MAKARKGQLRLSPEEEFELRFRSLVHPNEWVLDAGCAAGKFSCKSQNDRRSFKLVGVDSLDSVGKNSSIDFRIRGDVNHLPFADNSFHVVYARWLVEHLQQPIAALREFHRVLKPGGRLMIFTTNLLHYYGGAAKFTPHWFHLWFNRKTRGFSEDDIFPTYYHANTLWRLRELLLHAGFRRPEIEIVLAEGAPNVLAFNSVIHRLGMCYEFVVRRFASLSPFRMNLIGLARKD